MIEALHQHCNELFVQHNYQELLQAIVCGRPLRSQFLKEPLIYAGVIHLFVVSGGHLVFLTDWLDRLSKLLNWPLPKLAVFLILAFYGAVAGFEPPVLRALFLFAVTHLSKEFHLNWPEILQQLLSGGLALLFINDQWELLSLLMSWQASVTLLLFFESKEIVKATGVYLSMLPIISLFHVPSPVTILFNIALVPLFALFLLPLSIVSIFIPWLQTTLLSYVFDLLFFVLRQFEFILTPLASGGINVSILALFFFLLFLHAMLNPKKRERL